MHVHISALTEKLSASNYISHRGDPREADHECEGLKSCVGTEVGLGCGEHSGFSALERMYRGRGSPKDRGWRKSVRKHVEPQPAEGLRTREEAGQRGFRRGGAGPGKALWVDTERPIQCPNPLGVIYPLTQDNPLSSPVQEVCTLQVKTVFISESGKAPSSSAGG